MTKQITDWGWIEWTEEKTGQRSQGALHTGIVTIREGAWQPRHVHFEEQVIYVLQGQACSVIDAQEEILEAGSLRHYRAGVEHEIFNLGKEPFRHLLISNPGPLEPVAFHPGREKERPADPSLIYEAVEAVRVQFLMSLHYSYVIFDAGGNLILQSPHFPRYCEECCSPGEHAGSCECMLRGAWKDAPIEQTITCPYGILVYQFPVVLKGQLMGFVQGGYLRYSSEKRGKIETVYDAPETMVAGMKALFTRIVKAIRNYCEFEQFRRELVEKEMHIVNAKTQQELLLKDLRDTQYAVNDLQINHHFLFNTFNSMASMALDAQVMPLYQSIVDLSRMFHYSLRRRQTQVVFREEWEYVKAYLDLQKFRYGEKLVVETAFDERAMEIPVPFNFLQPIVENAFAHGFHDEERKWLRIELQVREMVHILVYNSGKSLPPAFYHSIMQSVGSGTAHGMSMVWHKLQMVYQEKCRFEIRAGKTEGSVVEIVLPIQLPGSPNREEPGL